MKSLADSLGINPPEQELPEQEPTPKSAKDFAKRILSSAQYRESIKRRIVTDTLSAAVECKLYDYAYGKPVDRVEVKDTTDRLEDLTSEELEARAMALASLAASLREEKVTIQ